MCLTPASHIGGQSREDLLRPPGTSGYLGHSDAGLTECGLVTLWLGKEAAFHVSRKICDTVQIEPILQVQEKGFCSRKGRWLSSEAAPGFHLTCHHSPGVCFPRGPRLCHLGWTRVVSERVDVTSDRGATSKKPSRVQDLSGERAVKQLPVSNFCTDFMFT